jgi:TPR repeat protein
VKRYVHEMRLELPHFAEDRAQRRAKMPEWIAAASSGRIDAQLALAWEYARGDAVDADFAAAGNWFERAAASGDDEALVHRARFLQLRGVPEGVRVLRKLAAKGNWKAQFWLAGYHQTRIGRFSQLRAVVWYDRSFKNGNPAANLAKLGQLTRVSPLPSKAVFAGRAIKEAVSLLWQMFRQQRQIDIYEPLLFRLKRK